MKTRPSVGRVFLIFGLILLLDALGALVVGTIQLRRAAGGLGTAATALRHDEIPDAVRAVERASAAADSAYGMTEHPGFRLLGALPWVDTDADAFRALARASRLSSLAADRVVSALDDMGTGEDGVLAALYSGGRVDLASVEQLYEASTDAAAYLDEARAALVGRTSHLPPLASALERADRRIGSIAETTDRGREVASLLPTMLGADGPRRYLLAFQSPSEARGGGGLIGVYGLLSADAGRVTLDEVGPIEDLGPKVHPSVDAPDDFAELYGPLSGLRDWRLANLSPNFPATSKVLLAMYERVRGERLDGVIALDPIALGELTRGTGPLEAEGWRKTITRNNARRLLLFRIYKHFVHKERLQNIYLRSLVSGLWERIESGPIDAAGLATGLAEAAAKHHFKVYSSEPGERELLAALGVAGDPSAVEGPLQLVFNNNSSANKLDFFLHRLQSTEISLEASGGAEVLTSVELANRVPEKGLRAAARSAGLTGLDLGENRMFLHFMLPRGSNPGRFTVAGRPATSYSGMDAGHPVEWGVLQVDPDETVVASLRYRAGNLLTGTGDARAFRFTLWPQATARPDLYEVTVRAPAGYLLEGPGGRTEAVVTVEGVLKEPVTVSLSLVEAKEG